MRRQKRDSIILLMSYKHFMFTKGISCLLIISSALTNATYGHDRVNALRMTRENGATEEALREAFGRTPAEDRASNTNAQTRLHPEARELQVKTLTKELAETHIDELIAVGTEAYLPTGEPLWGRLEFLSDSIDGGQIPLRNKWRYSQIAFYKGRVVGYLIVYQRDDKVIVSRFAVLPELQRRGLGVAIELIRKANEAALRYGVTHVETVVYCENPVISLYNKLGFKRIGIEVRAGRRFYKMRLVVAELNIPGETNTIGRSLPAVGQALALNLLDEEIPVHMDSSPKPNGVYPVSILNRLLEHSVKDAQAVNKFAIDLSRRTKRPVLVVGVRSGGLPFVWTLDEWWSQIKDPGKRSRLRNEFEREAERRSRYTDGNQLISKKQSEYILAKEWIEDGIIDWYTDLTTPRIRSFGLSVEHDAPEFVEEFVEALIATSANIVFVDDTNNRKHYPGQPTSFFFISKYLVDLGGFYMSSPWQSRLHHYICLSEQATPVWNEDQVAAVFLQPATLLPSNLQKAVEAWPIGHEIPVSTDTGHPPYYLWWDNINSIVGPDYPVTVKTTYGEMPLNVFVEAKFKELTPGWFTRHGITLKDYLREKTERDDNISQIGSPSGPVQTSITTTSQDPLSLPQPSAESLDISGSKVFDSAV